MQNHGLIQFATTSQIFLFRNIKVVESFIGKIDHKHRLKNLQVTL